MDSMIQIAHCLDKYLSAIQKAFFAVSVCIHPDKSAPGDIKLRMLNSLPDAMYIISRKRNLPS